MCSEECFVSYNSWGPGTPLRSTFPATPPSFRKCRTFKDLLPESETIWSKKEHLSVTSSCDRFIPNRQLANNDLSNFLLRTKKNIFSDSLEKNNASRQQTQQRSGGRQNSNRRHAANDRRPNENEEDSPPNFERFHDGGMYYAWSEKPERRRVYRTRLINAMTENCAGVPKVLNLTSQIMESLPMPACVPFSNFTGGKSSKMRRFIPRFPDKILDLPRISDAYGANIIDWSNSNDYMAVGLETSVYIWHPITKHCLKVPLNLDSDGEPIYDSSFNVTAVSWNADGTLLAMSTENGEVIIWDKINNEMAQTDLKAWTRLCCHQGATVSLTWKSKQRNKAEILYLAQDCECIWQYTVKTIKDIQVKTLYRKLRFIPHVMKLSADERYLGCCGDTGVLAVFDTEDACTPVKKVKVQDGLTSAMAWCPWQKHLVATGGGSPGNNFIRVWNVISGAKMVDADAKATVHCLVWSGDHKELISGHGGESNYVLIWKYPTMELLFRLVGHKSKILYLGIGLNRTLLATIGEDETLLLWRIFDCFGNDGQVRTPTAGSKPSPSSLIGLTTVFGIIR